LIDPLALDRRTKARFGYWALEARFGRPVFSRVVRMAGAARRLLPRWLLDRLGGRRPELHRRRLSATSVNGRGPTLRTSVEWLPCSSSTRVCPSDSIQRRSVPVAMDCLEAFLAKVRTVAPETDLSMIETLLVQYELQVRTQHRYQLRPYGGVVHLFEPEGPYRGLEAAQITPVCRPPGGTGVSCGPAG
jgi:hypothetical protein